jgi:hypothetical protein
MTNSQFLERFAMVVGIQHQRKGLISVPTQDIRWWTEVSLNTCVSLKSTCTVDMEVSKESRYWHVCMYVDGATTQMAWWPRSKTVTKGVHSVQDDHRSLLLQLIPKYTDLFAHSGTRKPASRCSQRFTKKSNARCRQAGTVLSDCKM